MRPSLPDLHDTKQQENMNHSYVGVSDQSTRNRYCTRLRPAQSIKSDQMDQLISVCARDGISINAIAASGWVGARTGDTLEGLPNNVRTTNGRQMLLLLLVCFYSALHWTIGASIIIIVPCGLDDVMI